MYESFYGFNASPFRLSPDPGFFFDSPGHKKALSYLRYGLSQKEGFIVVTGIPGTGKTTLARSLIQESGNERIIVSEINTTHLEADDVLRMVAASFGLEHENLPKSSLLKRLEAFFMARFRAGYHLLLMIDEAQNLPKTALEELRMLSNFYLGNHALLQIFLLGQEQFKTILYSHDMEQLRQRVVAACHLNPFTLPETKAYIEHRLTHVGWEGEPAFQINAFEKIYELTKGIPRRINTFCDRLFLYASIENLHEIAVDAVVIVANELSYELGADDKNLLVAETENGAIIPSVPKSRLTNKEDELSASSSQLLKIVKNIPTDSLDKREALSLEVVNEKANHATALTNLAPSVNPRSGFHADRTNINISHKIVKRLPLTSPMSSSMAAAQSIDSVVVSTNVSVIEKNNEPEWVNSAEFLLKYAVCPEDYANAKHENYPSHEDIIELLELLANKKNILSSITDTRLQRVTFNELNEAVRTFINVTMLSNKADYYCRLGLTQDATQAQVTNHYRLMFRLYQPGQGKNGINWDETFARKISEAYSTLRDTEKRIAYDGFLAAITNRDKNKVASDVAVSRGLEQDFDPDTDSTISINLDQVIANEPRTGSLIIKEPIVKEGKTSRRGWAITLVVLVLVILAAFATMKSNELRSFLQLLTDKLAYGVSSFREFSLQTDPIDDELKGTSNESTQAIEPLSSISLNEVKTELSMLQQPVQKKKLLTMTESFGAQDRTWPENIAIHPDNLNHLLAKFTNAYELGDLDLFMSAFSESARTNDQASKQGIREDYKALFQSTLTRAMQLKDVKWDLQQPTAAKGIGDFLVTIVGQEGDFSRQLTGEITLRVEKISEQLFITDMQHSYVKDGG